MCSLETRNKEKKKCVWHIVHLQKKGGRSQFQQTASKKVWRNEING